MDALVWALTELSGRGTADFAGDSIIVGQLRSAQEHSPPPNRGDVEEEEGIAVDQFKRMEGMHL
jgi:hypothetical protein